MKISIAATDAEIDACFSVMRELRPHIPEQQFVSRVRSQEGAGYGLAYLVDSDAPLAIAGFRMVENLAWGRFMYIDDLVTLEAHRSMGYGTALLAWLEGYALNNGCTQIHLDSAFSREDAYRFYDRVGIVKTGFHFAKELTDKPG